jgi:glycosyltransferase involved in cell wall biosynthesis
MHPSPASPFSYAVNGKTPAMPALGRVAFIGNSLPRRCGIATFSSDLQQAIAAKRTDIDTCIVAMTDHDQVYDYPAAVRHRINDQDLGDYARAADFLNASKVDIVSLQHEFGIFGGEAGGHIMALLSRLTMPIVTTLHTILAEPTPAQRRVLGRIVIASSRIIVMSEKGSDLLQTVYAVPAGKIVVIPHGIPDVAFAEPDAAKAHFGFAGRPVILTFGLLSPNKGIEVMIDAMPLILKSRPDAVYVVLGATHPNLVRHQGEAYREGLMARARQLGVADHVVLRNQFVDKATLLAFISMCDVYVTPYLTEAQMTSGTLAYSFGLGKAVVSTPYWHACELLADGRGILVPFRDAAKTGAEIAGLLTDDVRRMAMRRRAYSDSRPMTWERTGERYLAVFEAALRATARSQSAITRHDRAPPEIRTDHLLAMCDDTGIFQHAVHSVPDRDHGYCIDDNARALLVACALNRPGEHRLPERLTARLAAFLQHAWNPALRRFRNFMAFDRTWLEDAGSEDSHGRTLWALGECARNDASASRRAWAIGLFREALQIVEGFRSPRAWAFTLLGLDGFCAAVGNDPVAARFRLLLADRLVALLATVETPDWVWFEEGLSYDNARLSQALIVTGSATDMQNYLDAGLRTLRWLMQVQTAPAGYFRPVGTDSFGHLRTRPEVFDQQPLEAAAAISACHAAWRADGDGAWKIQATRAFDWFLGANDLAVPLVDLDTGSCRDGLHPDRANENRGGESVVCYILGLAEIRLLANASDDRAAVAPQRVRSAGPFKHARPSEVAFGAGHISEPPGAVFAPGPHAGAGAPVQTGD